MQKTSEHSIQKAYFDWARMHRVARRAYAIPNGGHRNIATAARLKAEGVRAGVLDVHLPVPVGGLHGLWIEFKSGYNKLTNEQAAEALLLKEAGFLVAVCWDTESAIKTTEGYLSGAYDSPMILSLRRSR